jgi:hypothetical protein
MECGVRSTLNIVHDILGYATEEHVSQICPKNFKPLTSPLKETDKGWHGGHA